MLSLLHFLQLDISLMCGNSITTHLPSCLHSNMQAVFDYTVAALVQFTMSGALPAITAVACSMHLVLYSAQHVALLAVHQLCIREVVL
jgi:hypothetical protein